MLRCNATGLPTLDISWGRERGKLDKKRFRQLANGNLHIRDIKMTDAGQYFCIAANIHDLKEVKVTLRVIGKRFVCKTIFRKLMTSFASCKRIHDSLGFRIPHRGFWIPGAGFEILSQWKLQSGFKSLEGFPDFLSCTPDSKAPDCRFHNSNFPDSKFHSRNFPDSGIRIPVCGATSRLKGLCHLCCYLVITCLRVSGISKIMVQHIEGH